MAVPDDCGPEDCVSEPWYFESEFVCSRCECVPAAVGFACSVFSSVPALGGFGDSAGSGAEYGAEDSGYSSGD